MLSLSLLDMVLLGMKVEEGTGGRRARRMCIFQGEFTYDLALGTSLGHRAYVICIIPNDLEQIGIPFVNSESLVGLKNEQVTTTNVLWPLVIDISFRETNGHSNATKRIEHFCEANVLMSREQEAENPVTKPSSPVRAASALRYP